jgi:hypothetical protein
MSTKKDDFPIVSLFDILAGDIGFNIQINKEYYNAALTIVKKNIYEIIKEINENKWMSPYEKEHLISTYKVGYDEMFLFELFQKITCILSTSKKIFSYKFYSFDEVNIYNICLILDNIYYPKKKINIDTDKILGKKITILLDTIVKDKSEEIALYLNELIDNNLVDLHKYILDIYINNLIRKGVIIPDDNVLSVNNLLVLLNEMPYKTLIQGIVFDLYNTIEIPPLSDEDAVMRKYLKYKAKYLSLKKLNNS